MRAIACGVVIGALIGGSILPHTSRAQPAPAPDLVRAKDLYKSAEAAVKDGRFLDAARDYGGAYEITRDPVLFFKIGSANERAGKCDLALIYYGRYLREARPAESFVTITRERIVACGGDPDDHATGSATTGTGSGSAEPVDTRSGSAAGSAEGSAATATEGSAAGSGSAAPVVMIHSPNRGAWILVASSIALVTVGGVLAYAANSAESDVDDLYVGFGGQPPTFDARTKKQYEDLIDEGNRYEKLSWVSFGLAGASAIGAAILFYRHADEATVQVTPAVTSTSGSVRATIRW